jgi:error-prone DNA polymerase
MLLNCHTYYSLRFGTLSPEDLVQQVKSKGWDKLVLTDINNTTAMLDFVRLCQQEGLQAVGGIEFRQENHLLYIGIASNNEAFRRLNSFFSEMNVKKLALPERAPQIPGVRFIYDISFLDDLHLLRSDEFVGIRHSDRFRLMSIDQEFHSRLLALSPVTFFAKSDFGLHRHLRAIDNNILLTKLHPGMLASADEYVMDRNELYERYDGFEFLLDNAALFLQNTSLHFDFERVKNKAHYSYSTDDDMSLLSKLAYEGMKYRYGEHNQVARARIDKELSIIHQLGFAAYFLITWDIIRYSLSKGYYHVGRGSGANSVVAYCLKIVDVDPIELDLYFERFINPKRTTPPDFDIDYSWKERDDVQDYIFKRYGRERVALLGAMSTFKGKSIYRELGKVYGLPKEEIDDLIRYPTEKRNQNEITAAIHQIAAQMTDFPNLRSIHAGGVLVSEEPITSYTALDMPPKGFQTTQWDMYVAEDFGYEKLDILSQRGIGHIRDAVEYIKANRGIDVDYHAVEKFKRDTRVREVLERGETIGCFYIESPAMRGLIRKLRCNNYLTLVAASSIIRPGVAKSGMMREYILRYNKPDSFEYLHPVMKEQLEETYGVMVYQEDVLKVCHHYAGLDLGDADVLRRAMSGKTRSKNEFEKIVRKFFDNSKRLGRPEDVTKEVWRQIESFAGYSFSKAHSASYAVESYQSLYLKAHFPFEFITAVINNFGGFYRSWVYFNEANRLGARVLLPDVNKSTYLTRVNQDCIYVGWIHLQQFERKMAHRLVHERNENGEYRNLPDFTYRLSPGLEQLLILIRIGAFSFTGKTKAALMWEAHSLLNKSNKKKVENPVLFTEGHRSFTLPDLHQNKITDAYDEIELMGFPLTLSYFDLLRTSFRGELLAHELIQHVGKIVRMVGHLVTIKYVKTIKKDYMHFATFIDYQGNFFDTVHFPDSLKKYPFRGDGMYLILGKVVEEFGYASLEVHKMAKLPLKENPAVKTAR